MLNTSSQHDGLQKQHIISNHSVRVASLAKCPLKSIDEVEPINGIFYTSINALHMLHQSMAIALIFL